VNFDFESKELLELYLTGTGSVAKQFPSQVIGEFFLIMAEITAAVDERDLRALKSRRFEKLHRGHGEHSMRLNKQFRLIFTRSLDGTGQKLLIRRIEDYH